jgi:hypothetical protein
MVNAGEWPEGVDRFGEPFPENPEKNPPADDTDDQAAEE